MEKEVVLVDMAPVTNLCPPMEIDGATTPSQDPTPDVVDVITPNSEALKVVKKIEFQLLCPQHNPVCVFPDSVPGVLCLSHVCSKC